MDRQEKWDRRYLGLAQYYAQFSKDPSTKVGAVLVDYHNRVAGLGYNGFPEGMDDSDERYLNRELKYKLVVHAEVNAIIDAGIRAAGSTLYVWPSFALPPICNECCKVAITAGVSTIVGFVADVDSDRAARWRDSIAIAKMMCDEAGIDYRGLVE
ncbi:MAG TPA: deaminase [Nitrosopumilaceae archaeon]|jgi:dCMP deaminase|nr:deaminase [Nitrosopumilaceae archaeon]